MKKRFTRTVTPDNTRCILEGLESRCLMHADNAVFRIDAGATAAYTDVEGHVWPADNGYSGGGGDQTAFAVAGTTDPKLYYTRRAGTFSYAKPVADGDYTLNLLFADFRNPGERKFNVTAEGKTILSNFDIAATAGPKTALNMSFPVTVTGGAFNLSFLPGSVGTPVVSAIELIPAEPSIPADPTNLGAVAGASTSVKLSWSDVATNNETGYEIQRSTDGGVNFLPVVTSPANVTAYADGGLTASTSYTYRVRAVNAGGASAWTNLASATTPATSPTPTPPPNAGVDIRVDAGNAGTFTDGAGNAWGADANFTGGWFASTSFAVANTTDDPLYITRRAGDFSYSRAVPNGDYTLKLLFADYLAAGQRKFNVSAEGKSILANYDIAASAGTKTAITKSFPVTVADGKIDVTFTSVVNYATISALELVAVTSGGGSTDVPAAPSNLTATPGAGKISLAWKDNSSNEQSFEVWRSVNGGPFMLAATRAAGSTGYDDSGLSTANSYRYYVRAINAIGASGASNSVTATPLAGTPIDTWTRITWSTKASAPVGKAEALRAVVGGKLYVFAGFAGDAGPVTRSDVYDPATNTWTRIADMPTRLSHSGVDVVGRDVYFAGGYIGTGPGYQQTFGTKQVWKYNVDSNTYSAMPSLPVECAGGGLVAVGRVLHYFGGDDINRHDTGVHFALDLDNLAAGWVQRKSMITPRSHMGAVNLNGKIYTVGGQTGNDAALIPQNAVEVYDPATDTWTSVASMPKAVNHFASAALVSGGRILTFGGQTTNGNAIADCYAYDPVANRWATLSSLPAARFSGVAGVIDGAIYFTTGSSLTTTWKGVPG
jgi:hypothetical protein